MSNFSTKTIKISATDGYSLGAMLFLPVNPIGVVQVNSATAVPKEFYNKFAAFLANANYAVCIYDYRGIGDSAPKSLKNSEIDYLDWSRKDMSGVLAYLREAFPNLPLFMVGHSVGGQKIGFVTGLESVRGVVSVASSAGYWGTAPLRDKIQILYFFYLFVPISTTILGYGAMKRFGMMEDLPTGLLRQWKDWCSVPDYFFDKKFYGKTVPYGQYDALPCAVKVLAIADDPIANPTNVTNFWKHVKSTKSLDIEQVNPNDFDLKSIGHFGFFRKHSGDVLWKKLIKELEAF